MKGRVGGGGGRRSARAAPRGRGLGARATPPPSRYVTVEGPVEIEELDLDERLAMARRYLGPEGGDRYVASNPDAAGENVMIRMRPEHWLTVDYGKRSR